MEVARRKRDVSGAKRSESFPPRPTRPDQVHVLIAALGSVFPDRRAWYLSTPITTGERFAQFIAKMSPATGKDHWAREHRTNVIEPNLRDAAIVASRLRDEGKVVIAPAEFPDIEGWSQSDYRYAWGEVIRRFAGVVVFMDGWEYSSGCAYEFLTAVSTGAKTLAADMSVITYDTGTRELRTALTGHIPAVDERAFIEAVLRELESTSGGSSRLGEFSDE